MNLKLNALFCLLLLSLIAHSTKAQSAPPTDDKTKDEQATHAAELEHKALALLDEIGDDARGLKLTENRVRLQVATADMLWQRDEKRAREIVNDALASLAPAATAVAAPDDSRGEQQAQELLNLRREIVQLIGQHDPQLALDFLRATRPPASPSPLGNNYQMDQELALEASLAEQVVARDPKQALRVAEDTLSRGFSAQLASVLERLRYTDAESASRLATDIARKLRSTNFATNYEATNLASYLLRSTRTTDASTVRVGDGGAADNQHLIAWDDQTRRDLLAAMASAALSASNDPRTLGAGRNLAGLLSQFMPEIERALPAQAQALRRISSQLPHVTIDPRVAQQQRDYETLMQTGTIDALLDAAAKSPPEAREQLYRSAAYKALNEGAADRARQIVTDHFDNPQQRAQLLREIDQQLFWRASNAGDVEAARAVIARITRPEERAGLLLNLARTVAGKGDKEGAVRLLDEVWNQIGGRARNQQQFASQLETAQVFAQVAPDRAFEIVEASVAQLNELISAASVVDGFGQQAFDQDELKAQGGYTWSGLVNQCGAVLAALARTDFERAVATADRLQRLETRLNARLAVARGVLAPNGGVTVRAFGRSGGLRTIVRN